jgi:hypothetical protein
MSWVGVTPVALPIPVPGRDTIIGPRPKEFRVPTFDPGQPVKTTESTVEVRVSTTSPLPPGKHRFALCSDRSTGLPPGKLVA